MGGEKCIPFSKSESITGSPPRRRGKAGKNGGCDFGDRITPAWAGKSLSGLKKGPAFKDHPRMGGEKQFLHYFADSVEDHPRMGGEKQ